jgi:hypothetical protein
MGVRKLMSFVLALTFLTSMAFSAGVAWATPAGTHGLATTAAQEVGDTVVINDIDGNEIGTASVDDIIDPFEDMRQTPDEGLRFLSVELTIENTGEDVLTVSPGNIGVVDDKGIIYVTVEDIDRTDDLEPLAETDLESGESISGALAVGFPEDGEIAQIIWLVGTGQMPRLFSTLDPVDEGDPVSLYTTDYTEEAILTADEVVDDFDDVRDGKEASRGFKFVGVTVTFENVSEDPIRPDPASVYLGTSDGIFWAQDTQIDRSDDSLREIPYLVDTPLAPGDSVSGFVGFSVPADLEISYVMYLPDSIRLIHIYDVGASGADDDGSPTSDDDDKEETGGLGPLGRKTPTSADDDAGNQTPRASGDECAGAADWEDLTIETLGIWGGVFQDLDLQDPGAGTITQIEDGIATIRDAAEQQEDSDPPPAAEELNELIVQAYADSADALESLLDAIDADDTAQFNQAVSEIRAIGESFTEGDVAEVLEELKSTCAEIDEL